MHDYEQVSQSFSKHGYKCMEFLGKGGFSDVFLCYSHKYKQEFAIKRTFKHKLSEIEYKYLVSLNHTNIIRLYDSFEDDSAQYLVMDYCQNRTIKEKGRLTYENFIHYAKQILEAVAYCHSHQIAHRDIKPENIFLDKYDHVKLADFGMAKHFDYHVKSAEKCGTIKYFAPEMFQCIEVDPFKADIWSLGITFFVMATGFFPFNFHSREELELMITKGEIDFTQIDLDPKIIFLIKKMTIKSQHNRPSAENLLELSIFKKSHPISYRRTHSNNNFRKSLPVDFKFSGDDGLNKLQFDDVLSYKEINRFPKLRRKSSNFIPFRTF